VDRTFIESIFGSEEANVERGGYLFEYEWLSPYDLAYLGPELKAYAPLFRPQTRDTDSIVNIYAPLEEMIRTINESADDDFAAAVGKHLDLSLFVKYLAIDAFMVEWDGIVGFVGMNNFYLYRFRNGLSQFLPKDKDASLAELGDSITARFDTNVLVRWILDDDEKQWKDFVGKNEMTWPQYLDGGFTGPIAKLFGVHAIPQTFTIDSDGVLQDSRIGDLSIEGKLKKLVGQARELQAAEKPGH